MRQIFLGAAIFPRKYGRSVILERPYILGNFAATIFPGDGNTGTCAPCRESQNQILIIYCGLGTKLNSCKVDLGCFVVWFPDPKLFVHVKICHYNIILFFFFVFIFCLEVGSLLQLLVLPWF